MVRWNWIHRRRWGLATGAALALVALIAFRAGWFAPLERYHLDYNFRHHNRVEADSRIVMIDINDAALQRVGHWPWPRARQADLVNVLDECGAEAILLDLVYAEPTDGRIEHPLLEAAARLDPPREVLGDIALDQAVYDDDMLAEAIARAGNVYVAMYFPLLDPDRLDTPNEIRHLIDEDPNIDVAAFARQLHLRDQVEAGQRLLRTRIDRALRGDFSLSAAEVATRLNEPVESVERHYANVKEITARYLVSRHCDKHPDAEFDDILGTILPEHPRDVVTPDRVDLRRAVGAVRAARYIDRPDWTGADKILHGIPTGLEPTLPIEAIAAAARRIGFVSFEKDPDGVLRRVPVMAFTDGYFYTVAPQLGFALALDVLGYNPVGQLHVNTDNEFCFTDASNKRERRLPLDERGMMLLNWHLDHEDSSWTASFAHVPAARIMEVASNRRTVADNATLLRRRTAMAVELMYAGAESAYLDYEAAVRRLPELEGTTRAELEAELAEIENNALAHLARMYAEIQGLSAEDDEEGLLFERIRQLGKVFVDDDLPGIIAARNATLTERNDALLAELRERVGGKLCFVGHTAAAQADMVNTPVFKNMPGVMAHANLVNMLLVDRIPTVASPQLTALLVIVCGALVTLITVSSRPWTALGATAAVVLALFAVSAASMQSAAYHIATAVPANIVFVTWASITLYRQLVEERQRRSFARELARNTSPAIAARIADQLDDFELQPQPAEVTCLFSDLQGFTAISEQAGVEPTQTMLNRYLGAMGQVLIEHGSFNKFMGDGIFAFFNAPIWPNPQHARAACEAALASREMLAKLKASAETGYRELFSTLRMRIGVHSGPVFVGYFGSEQQTDYTCIGDTVNLAARLESANKAFGTRILVSAASRERAGDGFVYRDLGRLQVKGKARAVAVCELLGREGEVDDERLRHAEAFARAVTAFQNRDWATAGGCFEACLAMDAGDDTCAIYLDSIQVFKDAPPPDDWNRAIELTTK